ncbi:hypothetical protein KCP73_11440 [Salmonella enterica subsp. enterica]|nr:hypothetical protein KCP73_11440 [Salmonella enterica subsp. enterica]
MRKLERRACGDAAVAAAIERRWTLLAVWAMTTRKQHLAELESRGKYPLYPPLHAAGMSSRWRVAVDARGGLSLIYQRIYYLTTEA